MVVQLNRKLLPVKGFYFGFLGATGSLLPYLPVYARSLGFSAPETGILFGVMPFATFLIQPLWGALADKTQAHKQILIACCVLSTALHMGLLLVPGKKLGNYEKPVIEMTCMSHTEIYYECNTLTCPTNAAGTGRNCTATCNSLHNDEVDPITYRTFNTSINETYTSYYLTNHRHVFRSNCSQLHVDDFVFGQLTEETMLCKTGQETYQCRVDCKVKASCNTLSNPFSLSWWLFFIIYLLGNMLFRPLLSINDALAYHLLGPKRGHKYGKQRLWGTIGFAVIAFISGFSMNMFHLDNQGGSKYTIAFYIFLGCMVFTTLDAGFLQIHGLHCSQMSRHFFHLFKNPAIFIILAFSLVLGMFFGVIIIFLFWFLKELQENIDLIMGLILLGNCIIELPMMFFAGRVMSKLGDIKCLYIVLVIYGIRFIGLSVVNNPWLAIPVETLHGIIFGLMWPALTHYIARISPPGMGATMQGILSGTHFGFGVGLGSVIGGLLYDKFGGRGLFQICGVSSFILILPLVISDMYVFKKMQNKTKTDDEKRSNELEGEPEEQTSMTTVDKNSIEKQPTKGESLLEMEKV